MSARNARLGIILWVAVLAFLDIALFLRFRPFVALFAAGGYVVVTAVFIFGERAAARGLEGWGGICFLTAGFALLALTTSIAFYSVDPVALAVGMPAAAAAIPLGALNAGRSLVARIQRPIQERLAAAALSYRPRAFPGPQRKQTKHGLTGSS